MRRCIEPGTAGWYLYSTPPKQVIEDTKPTLFQAGLVPAAKLYLGLKSTDGESLSHTTYLSCTLASSVSVSGYIATTVCQMRLWHIVQDLL